MRVTTSFLSSSILRKVRQIEIRTNRLVTEVLGGAYHSVFKGQGIDFEEVRPYTVGDEVRTIDWNVTAKMDRPYVKKFREERELTIVLLVDLSQSGCFGSSDMSKRELAAELASVLAFSATRNNDKVGCGLFTDRVEKFVLPKKGRKQVLRVIRDILCYVPSYPGTNVVMALNWINHILRRRAVVFLLTDFLQGPGGDLPALGGEDPLFRTIALTNKRHDLICVSLSDPRELSLPNVGMVALEDAETGEVIEVDTGNEHFRRDYEQENRMRLEEVHRGLRRCGVDTISVFTDKPYLGALRSFLEKRKKRMR